MNETLRAGAGRALSIVSVITFIGFLDTHLLIPVMALYASELGAGVGIVGLIVGLYSIVNTPANIFLGRLVDRLGYKLPLIVGLIGDAAGMFLYSLCRLPAHLALVRVLHGIAGGAVGPSTMSAIAHHSEGVRRGRSMAFYGMSLAAATLVGYSLSGVIISRLGYNAIFWLGGGLLVVGACLTLTLPGNRNRDRPVSALPAGESWRKAIALLRKKSLIPPYSAVFAQYFTFGGVVTLLPLYIKGYGMEAFHVGMMLAAFAVMFIVLQLPAGSLSDRFNRLTLAAGGLALGIIALLLIPAFETFWPLLLVMVLYGAAYGIIFPSISAQVADNTLPEERGLATGVFHALLTAGVAIGAPVMGWVGSALGEETGLLLNGIVMVAALVVTLFVRKSV
jgi:DHA1 family multidrug resistance protein-like MFS transporter